MSRIRTFAFAIILAVWCANASAMDGKQLAELCGETIGPTTSAIGCHLYIIGTIDATMWHRIITYAHLPKPDDPEYLQDLFQRVISVYCPPPDGVTPEQTMAVVRKRLRDKPSEWHLPIPAARYVVDALKDAFPCK